VALKCFKDEGFDFRKEAEILSKVRSPYIVSYLGIYRDQLKKYFIVMVRKKKGEKMREERLIISFFLG
jgi:serine/threonine protein kinase